MRRRGVLGLLLGLAAGTAGCGPGPSGPGPSGPGPSGAGPSGPDPSGAGPSRAAPTRATAADYAWFEKNGELTEGFCFTWVQTLSPEEVLSRLGARDLGVSRWRAGWFDLPGERRGEVVVAVTRVGGWTLMVEDNGLIGVDDDVVRKLSQGTRLIANYRNVEYDGEFTLAEGGVVQVSFDPQDPTDRSGADPDRLLADMKAVGLDLSGVGRDPADPSYVDVPYTEAAFALTQRVTGLPLTAEVLHSATYRVGALPDPLAGVGEGDQEPRLQPGPSQHS